MNETLFGVSVEEQIAEIERELNLRAGYCATCEHGGPNAAE